MNVIDQKQLQTHLEHMQTVTVLLLEENAHDILTERTFTLVPVADMSVSDTQGEKNNGFDVLYHNMKHGQISSKELTEFIRER